MEYRKDYYDILGIAPSATLEEVKAAHIRLALLYHPDTTTDQSMSSRFIDVSEAWQVLSKPESRAEYDALRAITLPDMQKVYKADTVNADGFKIQRDNFVHVQRAASSNWRDLGGKYQSEKWQKIPLADKKSFRSRPMNTFSSTGSKFALPLIAICVVSTALYIKGRN